jgi:hypothetical protein
LDLILDANLALSLGDVPQYAKQWRFFVRRFICKNTRKPFEFNNGCGVEFAEMHRNFSIGVFADAPCNLDLPWITIPGILV